MDPSPSAATATRPFLAMFTFHAMPGTDTRHLGAPSRVKQRNFDSVPNRNNSRSVLTARLREISAGGILSGLPLTCGDGLSCQSVTRRSFSPPNSDKPLSPRKGPDIGTSERCEVVNERV